MLEFLAGIYFTWWALVGLFVIALVFEHNDCHWWAAIFTAPLIYLAYHLTGTPFKYWHLAAYIPIGVLWSYFRWVRHCQGVVKEVEKGQRYYEDKIDVTKNKGRITAWILVWPFSMIESVAGDLIDAIGDFIDLVRRKTYDKISANARRQIEEIQKVQGK